MDVGGGVLYIYLPFPILLSLPLYERKDHIWITEFRRSEVNQ